MKKPKSPCGYHCHNCGTVHERCQDYKQFQIDNEKYRNMIHDKRMSDINANRVKSDGIYKVTGRRY